MTESEYQDFRAAVEDTFTSLYVIDAGSLSPEQRCRHQELLSAAYLAVIRLENRKFAELAQAARSNLEPLRASTLLVQQQLAGLRNATETLLIVGRVLDVLTRIAKVIGSA